MTGLVGVVVGAAALGGCATRPVIRDGQYAGQRTGVDAGEAVALGADMFFGDSLVGTAVKLLAKTASKNGEPIFENTPQNNYRPQNYTSSEPTVIIEPRIGFAPVAFSYQLACPANMSFANAHFSWRVNGHEIPQSNNRTGVITLSEPGTHRLGVYVWGLGDEPLSLEREVRVLSPIAKAH